LPPFAQVATQNLTYIGLWKRFDEYDDLRYFVSSHFPTAVSDNIFLSQRIVWRCFTGRKNAKCVVRTLKFGECAAISVRQSRGLLGPRPHPPARNAVAVVRLDRACASRSDAVANLILSFSAVDRLIFVGLYWLFPKVKPDAIVRWHRAGFRSYWRWKSRPRGGRPTVPLEILQMIREMSIANPLWGAPRIHGELLKLGIEVGQTTVAKYMAKGRRGPSQGWKTFLRNHADGIAAMDMFVVPTISFRLLYGLLIMGHGRRQILWFGVTSHPGAEWIANQLVEACGWEQAPCNLIHDRDGAYGEVFIRRLRSMGIRDRPTSPRSPW
jgi:hypothetical protein